jgi:hypothetical protein
MLGVSLFVLVKFYINFKAAKVATIQKVKHYRVELDKATSVHHIQDSAKWTQEPRRIW